MNCIFSNTYLIRIIIFTDIYLNSKLEEIHTIPRFKCTACSKSYKRKDHLERHLKFECGKSPQFTCPCCPYQAKHKDNLKRHVRIRHDTLFLFENKTFDIKLIQDDPNWRLSLCRYLYIKNNIFLIIKYWVLLYVE